MVCAATASLYFLVARQHIMRGEKALKLYSAIIKRNLLHGFQLTSEFVPCDLGGKISHNVVAVILVSRSERWSKGSFRSLNFRREACVQSEWGYDACEASVCVWVRLCTCSPARRVWRHYITTFPCMGLCVCQCVRLARYGRRWEVYDFSPFMLNVIQTTPLTHAYTYTCIARVLHS